MKQPGKVYVLLPEQDVVMVPWAKVTVDLIGLWIVKIRGTTT